MSYADIRTVNGVVHPTFRDACYSLGLLEDDKEPEKVWEQTWHLLAEDMEYRQHQTQQDKDLHMSVDQLKNYALSEIEKLLMRNGKSLKDYPTLPFPDSTLIEQGRNRLIQDELSYNRDDLAQEHATLLSQLNDEQRNVYNTVIDAVDINCGGVFFVYGYGGTGKTFIWKTLSSALRSKGEIVLTVASSGIASLLLPGGRTAHSRFCIPLIINEDSTCNIKQGSPLVDLIAKARLIIWDEAPMMHKHCFEALDKTLRDILRFTRDNSMNLPFGGKVFVFGGDFRQILPVIPKGNRQDIVSSSLNASYLWKYCKVFKLTKNMRLQSGTLNPQTKELKSFSEWILKIGDGEVGEGNDGDAIFEVPQDILIKDAIFEVPQDILIKDAINPLSAIVESTYPNLFENSMDGTYLQERAILGPTLDVVNKVNDYIMSTWPGEEVIYLSSDSISKVEQTSSSHDDIYTPEFLNTITASACQITSSP